MQTRLLRTWIGYQSPASYVSSAVSIYANTPKLSFWTSVSGVSADNPVFMIDKSKNDRLEPACRYKSLYCFNNAILFGSI
jgi:hypothetical protein